MLDDAGVDVTPRPMLSLKPAVSKGSAATSPGSVASEVDGLTSPGPASTASASDRGEPPDVGEGNIPSAPLSPTDAPSSRTMGTDSDSVHVDHEEMPASSALVGGAAKPAADDDTAPDVTAAQTSGETPVLLSDAQLDTEVVVTLEESEFFMILDVPARCVGADDPEAGAVEDANVRYKERLAGRDASEAYVEGTSQTLNALMKNKEAQESAPATAEAGSMATVWDIYDRTAPRKVARSESTLGTEAAAAAVGAGVDNLSPGAGAQAAPGSVGADASPTEVASLSSLAKAFGEGGSAGGGGGAAAGGDGMQDATVRLHALKNLPARLALMERCVTQNAFHDRQLLYRDFASQRPEPALESGAQALLPLWTFTCEATAGRNVACMAWNRVRRDMLVVGYGSFDFREQAQGGLVAFWSLKNPAYPDWIIEVPSGVTSVDFSEASPNLLAVGLYSGSVRVYDVRGSFATPGAAQARADQAPVLESTHANGKHSDPVWKLRWVGRGTERGESLMSISTDGRVTQWSITKGLEHTDLMKLKRVAGRARTSAAGDRSAAGGRGHGYNKQEAFISRRSSGMTFDFSSRDPSVYLAGTEDGAIHRCSTSYNEQYLESYFGHTGPVYQIAWSPFSPTHFLSASADWTIKLWTEGSDTPQASFQSTSAAVADCQWSPVKSTIFGSVTENGKLEVWDLTTSTLKPVVSHAVEGASFTSLLFSEESPVLVCGDATGGVRVFRLVGMQGNEVDGAEPALASVLSRPGAS